MSSRLDLSIYSLHQAYGQGHLSPESVIEYIQKLSQEYKDNPIWIHLLTKEEIQPYLDAIKGKNIEDLPLYGIPFAIKDNIDLAGIPTTAGCEEYTYTPSESAFVVEQLISAGAIPIGKTNLDQFATGLVGTRSPYGAVKNAFNADYVSGGSSSGSAVATALGLVSFSLGTDTAGSGRVPAALNNLIGLKPSRGLWSNRGVVPACRTLDCVTVFTLNPDDAETVHTIAATYDQEDAYSRKASSTFHAKPSFTFGVPKKENLQFFGNHDIKESYTQAINELQAIGGKVKEIDLQLFLDAAKLLYEGPWVAERYAAIESFINTSVDTLYPTTRAIIEPAIKASAVDAFKYQYKLQEHKRQCDDILSTVDFIVTPTIGSVYTIDEVNNEPIKLNSNLGYYTNFMNLLDYSAIAIPAKFQSNGIPCGITLFSPAFADIALLNYAKRYCEQLKLPMGNTPFDWQAKEDGVKPQQNAVPVIVCGAHMSGLPLNHQLTERDGELLSKTTTAKKYRLYALPDGKRPGMIRDDRNGECIEVEVWSLPTEKYGSFVANIASPLGIGSIELKDGSSVQGFICESYAILGAKEITQYGSWKIFLDNKF